MKRALRFLALLLAVATAITWAAMGANPGWTRTTVPLKTVDEVTGIEGIEYRKQFVPGIELLGGALLASGLLAGASLLFKPTTTTKNITEQ
jgi:hypothetical protein